MISLPKCEFKHESNACHSVCQNHKCQTSAVVRARHNLAVTLSRQRWTCGDWKADVAFQNSSPHPICKQLQGKQLHRDRVPNENKGQQLMDGQKE
jgi:hypothetical protein